MASSKNRTQTWTLDVRKKRTHSKSGTIGPKKLAICLKLYKGQCWSDSWSNKEERRARPHFRAKSVRKVHQKFIFWKRESWFKNGDCQFAGLTRMRRFHMLHTFMQFHFQEKRILWKLQRFLSRVPNTYSQNC